MSKIQWQLCSVLMTPQKIQVTCQSEWFDPAPLT